jgi:hypothetical protein
LRAQCSFTTVGCGMDERVREQRIAEARDAIAKRIKRVCRDLPAAEFDKLLDRMTLVHCKYDIFPYVPDLAELVELDRSIQEEFLKIKRG